MFIDAKTLSGHTAVDVDVCVVGAGAAGISIARELSGTGLRVGLFESGGLEPDRRTQALYRGSSDDLYSLPLDESRFRYFGGSTNRWAGWCRPLDQIDFERRDWIPDSGWPFGRQELETYYARASVICRADRPAPPETLTDWPLDPEKISVAEFRLSPPISFGTVYREELRGSRNVTVYLNANASGFSRSENGRIDHISFRTLNGRSLDVTSRVFILAAGGIENPRLLLSSAADPARAIGNDYDLVGRYYMDHPALFSGLISPTTLCPPTRFFTTQHVANPGKATTRTGGFAIAEATLRREGLAGAVVRFVPRPRYSTQTRWDKPATASARRLLQSITRRQIPDHLAAHIERASTGALTAASAFSAAAAHRVRPRWTLALRTWVESLPRPNNRVTLSARRNALGPVARVTWETGEAEKASVVRLHQLLGDELERRRFARIDPVMKSVADDWPATQAGASHHMGTTRMHDSERRGVVDRNCRVHGCDNLFVAGSSVFPTSGYANPTLTIVALAVRLADFVKQATSR